VTPTHVVGPGEIVYEDNPGVLPNERAMFASDASLAARQGLPTNQMPVEEWIDGTRLRIRLGRYDPLSTLSIMMEMNETLQPDVDTHGFFQCVVRFVEDDGKTLVTRVSTHRLPIARSVNDFLDAIDEDVVPVLLGREAVYRSMVGRGDDVQTDDVAVLDKDRAEILAYDARRDLDNTVHRISSSFRLLGLQNGFRRSVLMFLLLRSKTPLLRRSCHHSFLTHKMNCVDCILSYFFIFSSSVEDQVRILGVPRLRWILRFLRNLRMHCICFIICAVVPCSDPDRCKILMTVPRCEHSLCVFHWRIVCA
jgi:hypothetical protein